MAQTRFSGPVASDNGFIGSISATVVTSASANITTLVTTSATATSLNIGASTTITAASFSATVGTVQEGVLPVKVNGVTKYIALYNTLVP